MESKLAKSGKWPTRPFLLLFYVKISLHQILCKEFLCEQCEQFLPLRKLLASVVDIFLKWGDKIEHCVIEIVLTTRRVELKYLLQNPKHVSGPCDEFLFTNMASYHILLIF